MAIRPVPDDSNLKPPIFLLGNVRSGTTMVQDLFGLHSGIIKWFEPRTVWMVADPGRQHDRFDAKDATPRVKRYIRGRFLKYQRKHGNRRIMEKTPSNLMRIPYVHAIFPEAKYVYIVREPLANLSSSELMWQIPIRANTAWRRFKETPKTQLHHYFSRLLVDHFQKRVLGRRHISIWGVRYPGIYDDIGQLTTEQVVARQWVACSQQAESDLAEIDPALVLRIRYEDFVASPLDHFQSIAAHFELDVEPGQERALCETVDSGRQTKWRRLDEDVLRQCLPILREEMTRHGYELPKELLHLLKETPPET